MSLCNLFASDRVLANVFEELMNGMVPVLHDCTSWDILQLRQHELEDLGQITTWVSIKLYQLTELLFFDHED